MTEVALGVPNGRSRWTIEHDGRRFVVLLHEDEYVVIDALCPRSTCNHCGSENALDQRVPVLPSTAADAGVPAFSVDDAVAGFP